MFHIEATDCIKAHKKWKTTLHAIQAKEGQTATLKKKKAENKEKNGAIPSQIHLFPQRNKTTKFGTNKTPKHCQKRKGKMLTRTLNER